MTRQTLLGDPLYRGRRRASRVGFSSGDAEEPFTPDALAGLELWLKADGLSLNDNDAVSSWTDSSGNARHATQATVDDKPVFKTNIVNGKPVVRWTIASEQFLTTATDFDIADPMTLFAVLKGPADESFPYLCDGNGGFAGIYFMDTGEPILVVGGDPAEITANNNINDAFHLLMGVWDTADSAIYVDGGTPVTDAITEVGSFTGVVVGAGNGNGDQPFGGDIAEFGIYSGALSAADKNSVGEYLADKYALTWNAVV